MTERLANRSEVEHWRIIIRQSEPAPEPITDQRAAILAANMWPAVSRRTPFVPAEHAPRRSALPRALAS